MHNTTQRLNKITPVNFCERCAKLHALAHCHEAVDQVGVAQQRSVNEPVFLVVTRLALHHARLSRLISQTDGRALLSDQINRQDQQATQACIAAATANMQHC